MADTGKELKKLKVPSYPNSNEAGHHYTCHTIEEKTVSAYTGLTIRDVDELNVFEFWLYLRDAVIYQCMRTEDGKKYLENCWRMEQTKPDRKRLREKHGS